VVLLTDQDYDQTDNSTNNSTNNATTVNGVQILLTTSFIVIMDSDSKEIYNMTENVS
jgi:hypothetical protein